MKHLKYFENIKTDSKEAQYIQDFLINVGMFIDSIRKTWDNPEKFAMKMGSTTFRLLINGKFFQGKDIFKIELRQFNDDIWYIVGNVDSEYFPGESADCVRYITLKVKQELGDITNDKLEQLSHIRFTIEDMNIYLETEKYNL